MAVTIPQEYLNSFDKWFNWLEQFRFKTCVVVGDKKYTYGDFLKDTAKVRTVLFNKKVNREDYVGLCVTTNSWEYIVNLFGIMSYGAIAVPVDPQWINQKVEWINSFKMKAFIYNDQECGGFIRFWKSDKMNLQEIAIEVKEVENAIEGIPVATGGGSCLISQSSGSTGEPKNILLTQDNLLYCCQPDHFIMNAQKNLFDYEGVERTFCFLPLKRAVLLHLEIVWPMTLGWTIYLESERILAKPENFIKRYLEIKPHKVFCVTPLLPLLMKAIEADESKSIRMVATGGALMPVEICKQYRSKGIQIYNGYGPTETGTLFIANYEQLDQFPTTIGFPVLKGVKFKIVNGELWVKSPTVMKGYYNNGVITPPGDAQGWFHTGDMAHTESMGWFKKMMTIDGRKSGMPLQTWKNLTTGEVNKMPTGFSKLKRIIIFPDGTKKELDKD